MYLRRCRRSKGSKDHIYWELVESYRTERGPRQRVVAYLGDVAESSRLGVKQAATKQLGCWLGLHISEQLGLVELLERLLPHGREDIPWSMMAMTLVLMRLCEPSSELRIASTSTREVLWVTSWASRRAR